jgi:phosphate transport system permease protein
MESVSTPQQAAVASERFIRGHRWARAKDSLIRWFITLNGTVAILTIVLIFVFLTKDALPTFKSVSVGDFIFGKEWRPEFERFGILPLLAGSLFVTLGAVVIAVPLGIACAIYLAEIAPKSMREFLKPTIEVLAGIPSVVIGFIGLAIASPFIAQLLKLPTGLTALTGSIMLGFMAMPTIISISEDAIVAVPKAYRDGSLALGASEWETIAGVVLPAAKSGIIAACMLGVGRAIGETMTVLMVCGNAANLPLAESRSIVGILKGIVHFYASPVRTMTGTIAGDMGEIGKNTLHYHSLFAVGLALFAITFAINFFADLALRKSRK